jgi:diguanylate cyclase (GGDEF)-like protein
MNQESKVPHDADVDPSDMHKAFSAKEPLTAQTTRLVAANEHLVVSALRAQSAADVATHALEVLSRSSELDSLTDLPNRQSFLSRFTYAIAIARRIGTQLALLFLDLNNFKQINDTLGHAVGDQVLRLAAKRLAAAVRESDTVSRHGGDEFLILLTDVSHASDVVQIATMLISALGRPARVGEHVLRLTASIGSACSLAMERTPTRSSRGQMRQCIEQSATAMVASRSMVCRRTRIKRRPRDSRRYTTPSRTIGPRLPNRLADMASCGTRTSSSCSQRLAPRNYRNLRNRRSSVKQSFWPYSPTSCEILWCPCNMQRHSYVALALMNLSSREYKP